MNQLQPPVPVGQLPDQMMTYPARPDPRHYGGYDTDLNEGENEGGLNLQNLFWLMVVHRWLIAAFILTGIICGTFLTYVQTPKYLATARLDIETANAKG